METLQHTSEHPSDQSPDHAPVPETPAHNDAPNSKQAQAILAGITRLPTLPAVATKLLSMGAAEEVPLDEIIELIEADPALSARMLSLCRAADTGLGDRITTVRRAVIMLGIEAVRAAVLSVLVFDRLNTNPASANPETTFDTEGFWTRSIAVACVSEHIAQSKTFKDHPSITPDSAYLAGLVHALGKLALYNVLPKSWDKALTLASTQHTSLSAAERATIGIDHHTAGKRLAQHWGLPDSLRDVLWLYAQPPSALPASASKDLVTIITLANAWCEQQHLGWSGETRPTVDLQETALELNYDLAQLSAVSAGIIQSVSDRAKILGVGELSAPDLLLGSLTTANTKLAAINQELRAKQQIANRSHALLGAVDLFYNTIGNADTPEQVVAAMVHSGASLTGINRGYAILQTAPGAPWIKFTIDNGKIVADPTSNSPGIKVQSPGISDAGELRPAHIADLSGDQVLDLASLDWFNDMIKSVREVGVASLIGVGDNQSFDDYDDETDTFGDPDNHDAISCLVVLAKPTAQAAPELSTKGFHSVSRAWERALTGAVRQTAASLLAEQLASANRQLAELQQDRAKNESLLRLGQMAAGAAHEMNNPLAVINGRSQQLFERLGTQRDRESARAIAQAADALSSMITSMHLLAEPPEPVLASADPVLVVRQAIEQAKAHCHRAGIRAKVKLQINGTLDALEVDRDLMAKALSEPIVNAILSNPTGVVMVSIEPAGIDGRVLVRIADTGPGLSQKALNHAFDPFFSELKAGRRPGLGLARARSIIELHAGTISIANATGKAPGAQVQITLLTQKKSRRAA